MKTYLFITGFLLMSLFQPLMAQEDTQEVADTTTKKPKMQSLDEIAKNSEIIELHIIDGDTIPVVILPTIDYTEFRFADSKERYKYNRLKSKVIKVYPYAKRVAELMEEIEKETAVIDKKRHRKKYLKSLEKELKEQFEGKLRKLTISQGKILVKLIERETGKPMNTIIKDYKSPVTAFFWTKLGDKYGYDLKNGYTPEVEDYKYIEQIIAEIQKNDEAVEEAQTTGINSGID